MAIKNPQEIVTKGQQIYDEKYRALFEKEHPGCFVAIEVESGEAFLGETPEKAYERVQEKHPVGFFHLIKIGSPGAYKVSYTSSANNASSSWLL